MAKTSKVKVGDRFDKLEVLERAEDVVSKVKKRDKEGNVYHVDGKTKSIAWKCRCDCGKTVTKKQSYLIKEHAYLRSCGKCEQIENPNYKMPKMTKKEQNDWDALYEYVRTNIMRYDKEQSLSNYTVARLKGLATGNFMANKNTKKNANYSFELILNTFKFCSPEIYKALRSGSFKNEQHKINYIFKIVENNINDVYVRSENIKKAKEKMETIEVNVATHTGAAYKPKERKTKDKFLDLW